MVCVQCTSCYLLLFQAAASGEAARASREAMLVEVRLKHATDGDELMIEVMTNQTMKDVLLDL